MPVVIPDRDNKARVNYLIKEMPLRVHTPFVLLTLAITCAFILPAAVQHGMFMDGTQYACVARNMAEGTGDFWHPVLSPTWTKAGSDLFMEHPPLGYWLQSLAFRLFGDSIFVEKWFCMALAALSGYLVALLWRMLVKPFASFWWLPVLLWFVTPSVFWSFRNNMLENFLSVTVLLSVLFAVKAYGASGMSVSGYSLLSGMALFAGFMCKGLPALFPAATPLCLLVFKPRSAWRAALLTAAITTVLLFCFIVMVSLAPPAKEFFRFYFEERLLNRVQAGALVENRFTILFWVLTDQFVNIGIILLILLLGLFMKTTREPLQEGSRRAGWFFILMGLAGTVPLTLTHVQRATYFVPAMTFFALAVSVFLAPYIKGLLALIAARALKLWNLFAVASLLTTLVVTVCLAGGYSRDERLIGIVNQVEKITGKSATLTVLPGTYNHWDLHVYFLRYHQIAMSPSEKPGGKFVFLPDDAGVGAEKMEGYEAYRIGDFYTLYRQAEK